MRLLAATPIVVSAPAITLTSPVLRIPRTGQDAILAGVAQRSIIAERPRVVFRARPDAGSIFDWTAQLAIESWDSQGGTRITTTRNVAAMLYWSDGTIEVDLREYAVARATLTLEQWQGAPTTMRAHTVAIDACGESGDSLDLGSKTGTGCATEEVRIGVVVPQPTGIYIPSGRAFFAGAVVLNTGALPITVITVVRSAQVVLRDPPIAIPVGGSAAVAPGGPTLLDLFGLELGGGPSTASIALTARGT